MKSPISKIDRALKDLYNLDSPLQAEDFLVANPLGNQDPAPPAALYIAPPTEAEDTLSLGIYLNPEVHRQLGSLTNQLGAWTGGQIAAFGVAAEEISHFRYVVHNAPQGRSVSHLELELQGEIDRFILAFFAMSLPFADLFSRFFETFQWFENLSAEQKERYEEANRLAKAFLVKNANLMANSQRRQEFLKRVREFYRLSLEEKVSQASR